MCSDEFFFKHAVLESSNLHIQQFLIMQLQPKSSIVCSQGCRDPFKKNLGFIKKTKKPKKLGF